MQIHVRYDEIALKGGRRRWFEGRLRENVAQQVGVPLERVVRTRGRLVLNLPEDHEPREALAALQRTFGVASAALVRIVHELEEAEAHAIELAREAADTGRRTFKVETRRTNKAFPLGSYAISARFGESILEAVPELSVDVHEPELILNVEVRGEGIAVYHESVPGPGGMPTGTGGRALALLSGGIDSPVAAWYTLKRGLHTDQLYFHAFPYTGDKVLEKVLTLARTIGRWTPQPVRVVVVSTTKIQDAIQASAPEGMRIVLLRRSMYRLAREVLLARGHKALVTGESLGQVASQTPENLLAVEAVVPDVLVLRPLIGLDKQEIVDRAEAIGTYATSVLPFQDCCSLFAPKQPETAARVADCEALEAELGLEPLEIEALRELEVYKTLQGEAPEKTHEGITRRGRWWKLVQAEREAAARASVAGSEDLASAEESSDVAVGRPSASSNPTASTPNCDALRGGSARGLAEPRRAEPQSASDPESETEAEPRVPSFDPESETEAEPRVPSSDPDPETETETETETASELEVPIGERLSDYRFELPPELIAQEPLAERSSSRLMVVTRGGDPPPSHHHFHEIPELLPSGALLVLNETRVIPARFRGRRSSGGKVELLLVRPITSSDWEAIVRCGGRLRPPREELTLEEGATRVRLIEAVGRGRYRVRFEEGRDPLEVAEAHGHIPLPPYIRREDQPADRDTYQTVFARVPGAIAAPTAGLHFTPELLETLRERGVEQARLTLHVGPGTFLPVRSEHLAEHRMEAERYVVPPETREALAAARAAGRPIVACGTTCVRALETYAATGQAEGDSELFIRPPHAFRLVDALITNFHLPESTLMMLVSALAGREPILQAYREAVAQGYRFYSYGDAMLIR